MAVTWSNTNQAHMDGLNIMIYGGPGVGKTKIIGTLPSPLIISSERGNLTLRELNIPVAYIENGKDLKEIHAKLLQDKGQTFKSVALDSMTDIVQTMLGVAKGLNADPRKAYFEVGELAIMWMKKFRDIPKIHKYFVAQLGQIKDDVTGATRFAPHFPGRSIVQDAPYLFDILASAEVYEEVKDDGSRVKHHYLRCQPNQQYYAKDRSGVLAEFEQPDFSIILNKVSGVL